MKKIKLEYDYVVVGAGSSGCAVAGRLSEDPSITVCLLEAGPPDTSPYIHVPTGLIKLPNHKKLNWRFFSKSQKGLNRRSLFTPRGRTLGGSSSINGMVYIRGNRLDYDEWGNLGNQGWSWEDVKPFFLKSENNEQFDNSFHAKGGPLNVTLPRFVSPLQRDFVSAAEALQYQHNLDFNGEMQEGVGIHQMTQKNGRRWSSARAYVYPALNRENFTLLTDASVENIQIDGKRAVSVTLIDGRKISARKEIILSTGSLVSPKILMLSGIGDPLEIVPHGIQMKHNLTGVGKNLQDHMAAHIFISTKSRRPWGFSWPTVPSYIFNAARYLLNQKGWFSASFIESGGFIKSKPDIERPDIQLVFMPVRRAAPPNWVEYGHGYSATAVLLRPKSHGVVQLKSNNPIDSPIIDQRFFSQEEDLDTLLWGFKECRRIANSSVFQKYEPSEIHPGNKINSDDQLRDYIRGSGTTIFHPVGTCKMGTDKNSVVDSRLCVHGINGLRIADASIMPRIIGGNTNAPSIMIGEKAAAMIKEDAAKLS